MARIDIGVAGWSYPDWVGTVYPRSIRDPLRYLSDFVDCLEINSTFYRPATVKSAARWAEVALGKPGFGFTVKIHKDFTHSDQPLAAAFQKAFGDGIEPLMEAGVCRGLLAQFRYDFDDQPVHRDRLRMIRDQFGARSPLYAEVRHGSWERVDALAFLAETGFIPVHLDYPTGRDSFDLNFCPAASSAYFRLHGRNREAWFSKTAGRDETYDYLYSGTELSQIGQRLDDIAKQAPTVTVILNNHFRGKQLANALQLKNRVTGERQKVPPLLLKTYPVLAEVAVPSDGLELWT
jgi:uncharacterized protein YecE (DUF72 family)